VPHDFNAEKKWVDNLLKRDERFNLL